MIKTTNLKKTYISKTGQVSALKGVSLEIEKGDIYGIIGMSGAGKSTFLRCVGLLEDVKEGQIFIKDKDISKIKGSELKKIRQDIGIVFQGYNLFEQINVRKNIAFPLEIAKMKKEYINKRVDELLELVGLKDKEKAYPSQLSGGQQQRVAIARALANNPEILLCDEPTSALDTMTISSVLNLLKEINEKLGVTIVIITHDISAFKNICNKVAVLDFGELAEKGSTKNIFSNPQNKITKNLINSGGVPA